MAINRILNWYFSRRALPHWCILVVDCAIVLSSYLLVYAIHNGRVHTASILWPLLWTLLIYTFFHLIGFRMLRTYSGVIRYSSFVDLQRVGFSVLIAMAISVAFSLSTREIGYLVCVRVRDIVMSSLMAMIELWMLRVLVKFLYDSMYYSDKARRVFVYGVREGGISIAKSIRNTPDFVLAGFVSDADDLSRSMMLMGVHVYLNDCDLVAEMKKKHVDVLMVSPLKSESLRDNQEMVNRLVAAGIKIYAMPPAVEWDGHSDLGHRQLREIDIEDLLPRDKIEIDMQAIGELLSGKRILVTGAAGSIGSEISRQVAAFSPDELVLVDQAETPLHDMRLVMDRLAPDVRCVTAIGDISDQVRMEELFSRHRPDYVFHAAAYKHVPMMEDDPGESVRNNIHGTRVVADLAVRYGTKKFVMVSTDKAVNPTNVMGCSKRICEIYVQSLDKAIKEGRKDGSTNFVTTRFGNVLGSNGSVIPLFKEQIKNGGPVTVTDENIIRFFMLIPEACKLVLEAGTMGHGGEIFVFDMGKPVRIIDLARRMIQLSGTSNVKIEITGLRDGEKLYEEVLADNEKTLPTSHPKIKVAKAREYDYADISARIDALVSIVGESDEMAVVKAMKEIVPEFKSRHSRFEVLDK